MMKVARANVDLEVHLPRSAAVAQGLFLAEENRLLARGVVCDHAAPALAENQLTAGVQNVNTTIAQKRESAIQSHQQLAPVWVVGAVRKRLALHRSTATALLDSFPAP